MALKREKLEQFEMACYPQMAQKVCLVLVKVDYLCLYCTLEERINFEGFSQNGCYGNQPQSFKVAFYSFDANNSLSFTKQD